MREISVRSRAPSLRRQRIASEQAIELRHIHPADPAHGDLFVDRVHNEERRQRLHRKLPAKGCVLRSLSIDFEPDEPPGVPRE